MDNLRAVIKNLFSRISSYEILEEKTVYDRLGEDTFLQLGNGYIMNYSNDELRNMYYFLENEFLWHKRKMELSEEEDANGQFNVFDALQLFDDAVLIEENEEPKCQYIQLLRWRDMVTEIEEDLFITSFFAYRDLLYAKVRRNFFWKPVIGHNNYELNRLMKDGMAENHFHLKGSAPGFHLSWISLMNQVDNIEYQKLFEKYEKNILRRKREYRGNYKGGTLINMWRQAALIRLFLFSIIEDTFLILDHYPVYVRDLQQICSQGELEDLEKLMVLKEDELVNIEETNIKKCLSADTRKKLKKIGTARFVEELLKEEKELHNRAGELQRNILGFREEYAEKRLDYTICESFLHAGGNYQNFEILSGERWFMYTIFQRIYRKNKQDDMKPYFNWFYLYLVLKANIRNELLQTNENVGFDNFSLFENRKDVFVENTPYEELYLRMAVRDTIYSQNIVSLEARMAPKDTESELLDVISKYDKWITWGMEEEEAEELKHRYFYVLHFIKRPERCRENDVDVGECRHSQLRKKIKQQALALGNIRDRMAPESFRIKGIDAAAAELWCRPEVFAQAFRYLRNHTVDDRNRKYGDEKCFNLMATYHAGEDFLDILDGLRAIDEAIHFLNLKCGERIGHALALGVDVNEWYAQKTGRIVINKIRYLDNLVWLYSKIKQYNIKDSNAAILYIENRFDEYFQEIFLNNMEQDKVNQVIREAREYYAKTSVIHGYGCDNFAFNISVYYDAWKLRGDNPELYREGYFKLHGKIIDYWDNWAVNKEFPLNYRIRYNPETAFLVYMYHYNDKVKATGDQMVEIKESTYMRDVIGEVQKKYQQEVALRGIGIETNPSSNYRIGTFRRYDKHPIIRWYNLGLTNNQQELEKCPQLKVSINTDDQGVFATSIENEYGCMALALEKSVDERGNRQYNRAMIMQWLDNIRKMGISQSFGERIGRK